MAPVKNGRAIFNSIPTGYPEPGKTIVYDDSQLIDLETVPLNGGFLIKLLDASIDPYMRGRMRDPNVKSYSAAYTLGQSIPGYAVGVVIRSESQDVKAGDHVYGILEYQNYTIKQSLKESNLRIIENKEKLPWSTYVGALGMAGQTAYMAWKAYSHAKKGETVFVSGGAGPVGSLVIQLAKHQGLKVIASAGSEDKVQFMREIGADVAFNYKQEATPEVLEKEGPIDIYWDNVGGSTLEAALDAASIGARFIECGMISGYNTGPQPVKNLFLVIGKSITMQGFIVSRLHAEYADEFYATVPPRIASGELKHKEHIWNGLDKVGEAILAVQKGENRAKAVIHVAHA